MNILATTFNLINLVAKNHCVLHSYIKSLQLEMIHKRHKKWFYCFRLDEGMNGERCGGWDFIFNSHMASTAAKNHHNFDFVPFAYFISPEYRNPTFQKMLFSVFS